MNEVSMPIESSASDWARVALPPVVRHFVRLSLGLTVFCVVVEFFCGHMLHLGYPYNWPLLPPEDPFRDFYLYKPRFAFFHSPAFFTYQGADYLYPAPLAVFYRLFYVAPHPTVVFLGAMAGAFLIATVVLGRVLLRRGVAPAGVVCLLGITLVCAYPLLFEFEQANLEVVVWGFTVCGLCAFLYGRGYTAAGCLGIAASMKIFPLVFLGLFLARKQYREMAVSVASAAVTTLVTLWLLCPNLAISWRGTQAGVAKFRVVYMLGYNEVGFDHSLFALPKAAVGFTKFLTHTATPPGPETLAAMLAVYLPLFAVIGVVLYFAVIRKLPAINQVICLTIASILLPPVSYDYTLIHLYLPWALLVLFAVESRERLTPGLMAAFTCFAVVLSTESEVILRHHRLSGQIKAVGLMVLMVIALRHPFRSRYDAPAVQDALGR